ncbi:MAG: hypothetical protein JWN22_3855, partial [Nocardioides sp.]|nr:hypothetical protein [Nocardioides sp.]
MTAPVPPTRTAAVLLAVFSLVLVCLATVAGPQAQ